MKPTLAISLLLVGCATAETDTSNLAAYCTPENAYRLGSQSRAYFGVCPKESEGRFLDGLARGRQIRPSAPQVEPYYEKMSDTERQLLASASEPERERLRTQLRDLEWWSVHLINNKATFHQ